MTVRLSLIRHGQTHWNAEGRYTGQSDIPLNDSGREEARQLAAQLMDNKPHLIVSSDLKRAVETATIIAERIGVAIRLDARLREINQGDWEGMHFGEIKKRYRKEFAARLANPLEVAPPGGETIGQLQDRVLSALADIEKDAIGTHVAIVAHGLVLALIITHVRNYPVDRIWDVIPPNAQVEVVHLS